MAVFLFRWGWIPQNLEGNLGRIVIRRMKRFVWAVGEVRSSWKFVAWEEVRVGRGLK